MTQAKMIGVDDGTMVPQAKFRMTFCEGTGRLWYATEERKSQLKAQAEAHKTRRMNDKAIVDLWRQDLLQKQKNRGNPVIVQLARQHFNGELADPRMPYGRWDLWAAAMRDAINNLEFPLDVLHHAQEQVPFDHRDFLDGFDDILQLQVKMLGQEFPWFKNLVISDDLCSIPSTMTLIDGTAVSNMFLWHLRVLMSCCSFIHNPASIVEIGGGYGAQARMFMNNSIAVPKRYVIVDLPESLFFAETYLRMHFGNRVGYFVDHDPGTDILLCPVSKMDSLRDIGELVIACGSMQEMSDDWVRCYMKWIDERDPQYFYSLNYVGDAIGASTESRNLWGPCLSPPWQAAVINPAPPMVAMTTIGRNVVEILYRKTGRAMPMETWSVLNGRALTHATYVEGLELVRQNYQPKDMKLFLDVMAKWNNNPETVPKEVIIVADCAVKSGLVEFKPFLDKMLSVKKTVQA